MKKIIQSLCVAVATASIGASAFAGNITVKGSDTLLILAQKWAETYMGNHATRKSK